MTPDTRDRGSGTVLLLAVVAVVVVLAGLLAVLASAQAARARAQTAADLAALAGAQRIATPGGLALDPAAIGAADPCTSVRDVAARNGARVLRCAAGTDGVVEVEVAVDAGAGAQSAEARAGPSRARARGRLSRGGRAPYRHDAASRWPRRRARTTRRVPHPPGGP